MDYSEMEQIYAGEIFERMCDKLDIENRDIYYENPASYEDLIHKYNNVYCEIVDDLASELGVYD